MFIFNFRLGHQSCKLRFINTRKCSIAAYELKTQMKKKSEKDVYGFSRPLSYLVAERQYRSDIIDLAAQLDIDWVEYLKSIGGPSNIKPYGTFVSTPQLRALVRRGVPVALRALVWPYISRTDQYRRRYPEGYYADLLNRVTGELEQRVKDDIEKDLLR